MSVEHHHVRRGSKYMVAPDRKKGEKKEGKGKREQQGRSYRWIAERREERALVIG